jgi:hypothetical protein
VRKKATPAQIELAWLLAQKGRIVPIPGTTCRAKRSPRWCSRSCASVSWAISGTSRCALASRVRVGKAIPVDLYAAVAEVLAFVYRMNGRRVA